MFFFYFFGCCCSRGTEENVDWLALWDPRTPAPILCSSSPLRYLNRRGTHGSRAASVLFHPASLISLSLPRCVLVTATLLLNSSFRTSLAEEKTEEQRARISIIHILYSQNTKGDSSEAKTDRPP